MAAAFAQSSSPGLVDLSFDPGSGVDATVQSIVVQPDGKIIVGGWFTTFNGTARNGIVRLNADGSVDAAFNPGTGVEGGVDPRVYCASLQADGKILIGGAFSAFDGTPRKGLARLNANGSLDSSFTPTPGVERGDAFGTFVYGMAIQSDGKVVIGGNFTNCNGVPRPCLARLHGDGSLDTNFNVGAGADHWVTCVAVQPDGKLMIAGDFTHYDGTACGRMARLQANGALDTTFLTNPGADRWVQQILLRPGGQYLAAGKFTSINSTNRHRIALLNADGTVDPAFDPGAGVEGGGFEGTPTVISLAVLPSGYLYIGGDFTNYNTALRQHLARLRPNGSLDTNFPNAALSARLWTTAVQPDGRLLIGGEFTNVNGVARSRIACLHAGAPVITAQPVSQAVTLGSNAVLSVTAQGAEPTSYQWWFNAAPLPVATNASLAIEGASLVHAGSYFVVVTDSFGSATSQVATLRVFRADALPPATTNSAGALVLTNSFGDVNDDGPVNLFDLVALVHHLSGVRPLAANRLARAELNQDGQVTHADRRLLADMIAARHAKAEDDFDEDELDNAAEIQRGTNPFDPDSDHDGGLDGWEAVEGTDPLNAQSRMNLIVVARPPVQVIHPLVQDTDTNAPGPVVARPPIQVIFPAMPEGEEVGAITLARPPVQVIHPLLQSEDTNSALVLARPPVMVIHPLIKDTDTNAPGPVLARPPVQVVNPTP
ncbi:MAG: immunoglobulin domain-containing protein [Verrucomicrobia bacterium]|nr:immunoglobulin domain-containing protein [Verrucomicrobiota bacterium]